MKGCFVQEQVIVLKYKCGFLTDRRDIFFACLLYTALLVTDLIVVILAFLIFDTLTGLCSVLGLMAKTLLIDKTIERMKLNKFFTIISNNPQPICDFITKDLNHSATLYDAVGAYSDQQRTVILTVVDVKQAVYPVSYTHLLR